MVMRCSDSIEPTDIISIAGKDTVVVTIPDVTLELILAFGERRTISAPTASSNSAVVVKRPTE